MSDSLSDDDIRVIARAIGFEIPEGSMEGVRDNVALLRQYSALVQGLTLPESVDPAYEYMP